MTSWSCAVGLAVALAGCGSGGSTTGASTGSAAGPAAGSSSSAAAAAAVITIKDFGFTVPASVSPGERITVRNMDSVAHTVTADSGHAFDDSAVTGNSSFTAPSTPGTYSFHCSIHPEMHGSLVVK